ncbi:glycosyltransferase family 2 protein [Filimonas effusa]|nr:glycosyltransferase family 2 protein [Filimonas effusa]
MNKDLPPLVSVVMCTYNGEKYIDEQITSILQQRYENFELIVADDRSTDNTWSKLLYWQQQHPEKIKLFQNAVNLGYNKNFESAIQKASGDFIALSDQDDIWLPEKITAQMAAFSDDTIVLVHNKSVRLEGSSLNYKKAALQHHFSGNRTRKFFFFNHIMGHDMIFRRSLVQYIVPIPDKMSYDWWISVVATCLGSVVSVGSFLVHHRIHESNNFFSSQAASKKKELDLYETLRLFSAIPALRKEDAHYLAELIPLLEQQSVTSDKPAFNWKLFRFLLKHSKDIFGHKRRLLPALSYLKNAIKYSKMSFKGRGISI